MVDTEWSDISSYQPVVTDAYPFQVLAIRSNDGDYRDPHFGANYAWALHALSTGKLRALIVYFVYRQNWQVTINTHKSMLGGSRPDVASMIDVESWGGKITGDQSGPINAAIADLQHWHGSALRVIGYGNRSDLDSLWPVKPPGMRLIVAAYGSNPNYPGKLGHQFTDGVYDKVAVAPFGFADVNSADNTTLDQFMTATGLGPAAPPPPPGPPPVIGAIADCYVRLGGAAAFGPATAAEMPAGGGGRWQPFSGGATFVGHPRIYWHPTRTGKGAHAVAGAISDAYAVVDPAHPSENGWLGYPVSEEYELADGRGQDFEHGSILFNAKAGAHALGTGLASYWRGAQTAGKALAWPSGGEVREQFAVTPLADGTLMFWRFPTNTPYHAA